MHSKRKGNIGQFAVAHKLAEYGFSVFTEEGDISKIDLIAEKDCEIIRMQVKSITPVNNSLIIKFTKSGPNYHFKYNKNMFDYFAIYDLVNKDIYLLKNDIMDINNLTMTIRLKPTKNKQTRHIRYAEEFLADNVLSKLIGSSGIEPESEN